MLHVFGFSDLHEHTQSHPVRFWSCLQIGLCSLIKEDLNLDQTYERYTGSPPTESSSLGSSMNGSESRTHWVCLTQKERANRLTIHPDLPKHFSVKVPKQTYAVISYVSELIKLCTATAFRINQTDSNTKPPQMMNEGMSGEKKERMKRGEEI